MTNRRVARGWPILAALCLLLCLGGSLFAQSNSLPPKPTRYIADQAGVLDQGTLAQINNQLEQFERDTSNQIVVALYSTLPDDAEVAQYTIDTYNAWGLGQKGKDNGALLMIFVNSRKMFICTGRGLEGALPDAICNNIITQILRPSFRQGDYSGGVQAAVNAMIAATKGEYKGTGRTVDDQNGSDQGIPWGVIIFFIIIVILSTRYGSSNAWSGPVIYTGGGYRGGGGGFGGGGFGGGGGGGGGFSGGGGSSAGGGAGGSW